MAAYHFSLFAVALLLLLQLIEGLSYWRAWRRYPDHRQPWWPRAARVHLVVSLLLALLLAAAWYVPRLL